jgi:hypothetical protein
MADRAQPATDHAHAAPAVDPTSGERVLVSFEGGGGGTGELSWGQQELWLAIKARREWLPIGTVLRLPAGTTVDDTIADLRHVMSRYPSMRTRLRFGPDGPFQVVADSGEIPLEIVDVDAGADPDEVAEQVRQRYWNRDYDFVTEWPVRMAVIRHRGLLTHRVWVMCHLVTDGTGARVILSELAARDSSAESAAPPLEQARWEGSPAGQRQCRAALRHWERILRSVTANRFPERTERPHPRYWQARFRSPAMHLAFRLISARTRAEMASVLLTTFAVALARVTGVNPVVVVLLVNNRFRPRLARTVSPVIHPGLCLIDVPDLTFDQAVMHTRGRAIAAYKYAYYDPRQREELIERVNRERGQEVDLECSLNDSRLTPRDETGPPPTPEQVRAALDRSTFQWIQKQDDRPYDKLYVTVDDAPDPVQLTVVTDIHHVAPDDIEAFVRGMEEVAVAAALDPATRTQVRGADGPAR